MYRRLAGLVSVSCYAEKADQLFQYCADDGRVDGVAEGKAAETVTDSKFDLFGNESDMLGKLLNTLGKVLKILGKVLKMLGKGLNGLISNIKSMMVAVPWTLVLSMVAGTILSKCISFDDLVKCVVCEDFFRYLVKYSLFALWFGLPLYGCSCARR